MTLREKDEVFILVAMVLDLLRLLEAATWRVVWGRL
jgi:hypothetical protein